MPSPVVDKVMADARAASFTTRSIKGPAKLAGLRLALSMVDLTTLEGKDSPEKVRSLCRKAVTPDASDPSVPSVAAVCVYPALVAVAGEALDHAARASGTPRTVMVASVATGFPSGQYPLDVRLDDTRRAVADGADEIDMVINRGALLAGKDELVADEIRQVCRACRRSSPSSPGEESAHLKVILETGELETYDLVRRASDIAITAMRDEGHDHGFIKTSTGKVQPAATMPVTLVMLEAIRDDFLRTGRRVGMKPAGGIASAKQALHYLVMLKETLGDAWLTPSLFRFGASSLANDLLRQISWVTRKRYAARYDFSEA